MLQHTATHLPAQTKAEALALREAVGERSCLWDLLTNEVYRALQYTATYCNTPQHTHDSSGVSERSCFWDLLTNEVYRTLQHTATHCNTLQHTAAHCNTLQHTHDSSGVSERSCLWDLLSNEVHRTAAYCNTMKHTATHCNTLMTRRLCARAVAPRVRPQMRNITRCDTL